MLLRFDEISNIVISRHPSLNWTIQYYHNGTLTDQIKRWYVTKFIFGAHSSALFGCYFMQPNSIVAAIGWKLCFHSLQYLAVFSGLYFVHNKRASNGNKTLQNLHSTLRRFNRICIEIWGN